MPESKNTRPSSRRVSAPKKPKTKPAAIAEVPTSTEPAPKGETPDWVGYEPLADFRLIAWDSDEKAVEILLTSYEFSVLKERLAKMRGYAIPPEAWHHAN
jgi:hypothetical protein